MTEAVREHVRQSRLSGQPRQDPAHTRRRQRPAVEPQEQVAMVPPRLAPLLPALDELSALADVLLERAHRAPTVAPIGRAEIQHVLAATLETQYHPPILETHVL